MNYKIFARAYVTFLSFACINNSNNISISNKRDGPKRISETSVDKPVILDTNTNIEVSKRTGTKRLHGTLHGVDDHIKITVNIIDGDSLCAVLAPTLNDAIMRINQVILPDGSADGPFARSLKYAIKKPGIYTLIISNNLMAEGKTTSDYDLELTVKDKL